jgi:dTDP-4-amino-4,6-dideoxygalactose transaminase
VKSRSSSIEARRRTAAYYNEKFRRTVIKTPFINPDCISVYNQYVIGVPNRDGLAAHLRERGIGCEIYYPLPMHLQECFEPLGYRQGDLPESERAAKEVLAIPVYSDLTEQMKEYASQTVAEFYGQSHASWMS